MFILIGALVHEYFMRDSIFRVFFTGWPYWQQAVAGVGYGIITSLLAWRLIQLPVMKRVRQFFLQFLKPFQLRFSDILFISCCAGIGEELLFRTTVQPVLGVWLTALVFVALHGYLSVHNWPLSIYGGYMVLVAAGLGYLFQEIGIVAAILGHVAIDVALLLFIRAAPMPADTYDDREGSPEEEWNA